MTISVVSICNRALDLVSVDPITSLEDGSRAANMCQRNYEPARDRALRSYPWNCAMARTGLPALAQAPAWGYARQFQLPEDCLRAWRLEQELRGLKVGWRVEGRVIVTDEAAPLNIEYIRRVEDPALFDPLLAELIAAQIAVYAAAVIVEAASRMDAMRLYLKDVQTQARLVDAQEGSPEEQFYNHFLEARF